MLRSFIVAALPLLLIACAHAPASDTPFEGEVVHVVVEGGFYGIRTTDGRRLDPVNLPDDFKQDGLPVTGAYVAREGAFGFHMWGEIVELTRIRKRGEPEAGSKEP